MILYVGGILSDWAILIKISSSATNRTLIPRLYALRFWMADFEVITRSSQNHEQNVDIKAVQDENFQDVRLSPIFTYL